MSSGQMTSRRELQEALLLHQELEDIHQRLEIMEAMPISFSFKDMLSKAKTVVAATKNAIVAAVNPPKTPQEVSNYLHARYKVIVAMDAAGHMQLDLNGVHFDVRLSADKKTWEVACKGSTYPMKDLQEMGNFIDAHSKSASAAPAPGTADYADFVRHSRAVMRCKAF